VTDQDRTVELELPDSPQLADVTTHTKVPLTYAEDPYVAEPGKPHHLPVIQTSEEAIRIARDGTCVMSVFIGNIDAIEYRGQLLAVMMEYHGEPGEAVVEMLDSIIESFPEHDVTTALSAVFAAPAVELLARYTYALGDTIWPHRMIPSTYVIAAYLKLYNMAGEEAYERFVEEEGRAFPK
jgi:hypothetical protein